MVKLMVKRQVVVAACPKFIEEVWCSPHLEVFVAMRGVLRKLVGERSAG